MIDEVIKVVEENINPLLAQHGGKVKVEAVNKDGVVYVSLSGGCQGCAKAKATLKSFVKQVIVGKVPTVSEVIDVTDHSQGENPYYKEVPGKENNEEEN